MSLMLMLKIMKAPSAAYNNNCQCHLSSYLCQFIFSMSQILLSFLSSLQGVAVCAVVVVLLNGGMTNDGWKIQFTEVG